MTWMSVVLSTLLTTICVQKHLCRC